jgi:spermidine synthase
MVFFICCVLGVLIYVVRMQPEEFVLFTTGFLAMGSEMLVIFAFQIFLGYIYLKIGIIVTVFLSGLLPGAWLAMRTCRAPKAQLIRSDVFLIVLLSAWMVLLRLEAHALPAWGYYLTGFCFSLICGYQFPLALAGLGDDRRAATRIFAVDLVGAACGVLITSTLFIPYLGLQGAAGGLIIVKLLSLTVMGGRHAPA